MIAKDSPAKMIYHKKFFQWAFFSAKERDKYYEPACEKAGIKLIQHL